MNISNISAEQRYQLTQWRVGFLVVLTIALSACATSPVTNESQTRAVHPIEGIWRIDDAASYIEIRPCKNDTEKLCGHLIAFDGNPKARDYLHPSWLHWGQKLCGSLIVADLEQSEAAQIYRGTLYDPNEGQVYNLIVLAKSRDEIEARIYLGASIDEAIGLGVGALSGDTGIVSLLSFFTRAGIGREHLGETVQWRRASYPIETCSAA
ncbi:DUF2147 domain-containing protein [Hyphomonas sp.]|uniref:DUF2147 domain-containing protein n=1 Tax=Hyphomonas sp. TaxID=87 RepID=UPI0025BB8309|nr:DUF2147 domain-containing protein [Hyphomonas sp.]